jgi:glyoxalase family protein
MTAGLAHPILGLHHVTATVAEAQADLDFGTGTLGLRLVKKTVNFDNHYVYHFYYGDALGTPGTIWTTFPYAGQSVPPGRKGTGQIGVTSFSVPAGSLDFWRDRLRATRPVEQEHAIAFDDPSGLRLELVADERDRRAPWSGSGVDGAAAIRGLHSVTLVVTEPGPTVALLTGMLGFRVTDESEHETWLAVNGDLPGRIVRIRHGSGAGPARNGLGTVHHVALAIAQPDEQLRLRAELLRMGLQVTEVRDRQYFQSIYFREPGGVLLEVATVEPGFAVDEPPSGLGCGLMLPPWEEPNRALIEANLPPVTQRE